jgi:hypothetical protein
MSLPKSQPAKKATLGEMIFGHAILILGCVLFPAFVTAIVPLSVTHFTRSGEAVRAEVSKRLLFVVPYRHLVVENVISVNDQFRHGTKSTETSRRPGSSSTSSGAVSSEDEAFLLIEGDGQSAKVEVSPVNIRGVLEKTRDFLENPSQPSLKLITVANWKFGVIGGGLVSLLTAFYLFIMIDSSIRGIWRRLRGVKTVTAESQPG